MTTELVNGLPRKNGMDLTRGWLPVTVVISIIVFAIGSTTLVVGKARDYEASSLELRNEILALKRDVVERLTALEVKERASITETDFDNWRLRFQLSNAATNLIVPEFKIKR